MKFTRNLSHLLFGVFCWSQYFDGRGYAADVVTSCPEYFVDGQINTITCTVNITSILNAQCLAPPTDVVFKFTSPGLIVFTMCSSPYPPTQCAPQSTKADCFCAQQAGEIITYQYNYLANKRFQAANITCEICQLNEMPIQRVNSPNCSIIQIVTTTNMTAASEELTTEANSTTPTPFPTTVVPQSDGTLTCPSVWKDQDPVTLTCEVHASRVNCAACPGLSGKISFDFITRGGSQVTACMITPYLDAACDGVFNAQGCRCREKTANDTYILEYTVTADVTTHVGGSWACVPVCLDSNYFPITKTITAAGNCTNVYFETPEVTKKSTTTGKVTTVTTTTTSTSSNGTTTVTTTTTTIVQSAP